MRMVLPNATSSRLMDELASDVGTLFDSFFADTPSRKQTSSGGRLSVPMDIEESADQYTVTLDVPGVPLEALEIDVHEDRLRIAGERSDHQRATSSSGGEPVDENSEASADDVSPMAEESAAEKTHAMTRVLRSERRRGTFERQVQLPLPVEADQVSAELADGVLTVTLPKSDPEQGKRRIPVRKA